jgi:hypothetical protein
MRFVHEEIFTEALQRVRFSELIRHARRSRSASVSADITGVKVCFGLMEKRPAGDASDVQTDVTVCS